MVFVSPFLNHNMIFLGQANCVGYLNADDLFMLLRLTLIVRSSPPRATVTLIAGRFLLASWVSTVALMAFCKRETNIYFSFHYHIHVFTCLSDTYWWYCGALNNGNCFKSWWSYLEKLKQHVVEMGGDVGDVDWLLADVCCDEKQTRTAINVHPAHACSRL